jgi:hypothetical protein
MGFARSQSRSVPLPLIVHFFKPRQVAQPRVVILVELSLSDVFFFHARKFAQRTPRAMLLSPSLQFAVFVTRA